jgi:hypothetical protein
MLLPQETLSAEDRLKLNTIRSLEKVFNPSLKDFHYKGRVLRWGENIPPDLMQALKEGEVLTLLDEDGQPLHHIMMDANGTIRQGRKL